MSEENLTKKSRNFCFTMYGYPDNAQNVLPGRFGKVKYLCWGWEICPTTQRPHLQGYVEFVNARNILGMSKSALKGISFRHAKGSGEENRIYCSKPETKREEEPKFFEMGEMKAQGKRTDLNEIRDRIVAGDVTVDEITVDNPETYHQYGRTLEKLEDISLRKKFRTWMTTCDYLWGPTGTNKSKTAFAGFDPATHYAVRCDKGWWEGYTGQEIVIFDDFRGQIPYNELLKLIDWTPYYLCRRGREPVPFLAKHIIITTPFPPEELYPNICARDSIAQLLRRIKVQYMGKPETQCQTQKCSEGNNVQSTPLSLKEQVESLC